MDVLCQHVYRWKARRAVQNPFRQCLFTLSLEPAESRVCIRQVSRSSLPSIVSLPQSRSLSSIVLGPCQTALLPLGTSLGDSGSSLSGEPMLAKPHFSKESVRRLNPQLFVIGGVMRSVWHHFVRLLCANRSLQIKTDVKGTEGVSIYMLLAHTMLDNEP